MKGELKAIEKIENEYGPVMFRMAVTHLFDVGVRHMTDENVDEAIQQITVKAEEDKAKGGISIMTPEFQCGLIRCAAELARVGIWDLLYYIKERIPISED